MHISMNKKLLYAGLLTSILFCLQVSAMDFDPLFYVSETQGDCFVTLPNKTRAVELEPDKAYPFGTRITTGPKSEIRFQFSEGNRCVVAEKTSAVIAKGSGIRGLRIVKLERGTINAELSKDFNKEENLSQRVTIESTAGIGEPTEGGEYSATVTPGKDLTVCSYHTINGEMQLYDNHLFEVPALKHGHTVDLSVSTDKSYVLLHDVKGRMLLDLKNVKDEEDGPKIVEMQQDYMIKMWRKLTPSRDTWVVNVIAVDSTGGLVESVTYHTPAR